MLLRLLWNQAALLLLLGREMVVQDSGSPARGIRRFDISLLGAPALGALGKLRGIHRLLRLGAGNYLGTDFRTIWVA